MAGGAPILLVDDNVEFVGLLGTLFSEQGLSPVLAHSGSEALFHLERQSYLAVVVDLLLPDTTGQRLLKTMTGQMREMPPAFVMTGVFKGESQRKKVESVVPLAGWYEKPFDTRLLVEKVVQVIGRDVVERRKHQKVGQVVGDFQIDILDPVEVDVDVDETLDPIPMSEDIVFDIDEDDEDDDDIILETHSQDIVLDDQTAPPQYWDVSTQAPEVATELGRPVPPQLRESGTMERITASMDLGDLDQADGTLTEADPVPATKKDNEPLDPFGDNSSGFGATMTPSPAQVAEELRTSLRSGDLSTTSVPRLINAFYIAQETGEIAFERGAQRKIIYFERGWPVYALSNQSTDRLGVFAKRFRGITHKRLEEALEVAKSQDRLIVDVLISQRLIDPKRRDEIIREQTRGLVRSLFTWTTGRYIVGFSVRTNFQPVELVEHPGALVLGGVRDLYELERLRELLPDEVRPIPTPNPPFGFEELPLHDAEALLMLSITGTRTIGELLSVSSKNDERSVRAVIYALLCLGVLGISSG